MPDVPLAADTKANGYHVVTAGSTFGSGKTPVERTPGGDFAWLKTTFVGG